MAPDAGGETDLNNPVIMWVICLQSHCMHTRKRYQQPRLV